MIDFIRVHYDDKNQLETFVLDKTKFEKAFTVLEYHSGVIMYPYRVNLENMEIVINEKSGYVKNSIHKLNNLLLEGDEHNYNDFSYSQLCSMIDFLNDNVIDIASNKITQFEFGLNIKIPVKPEDFISKNVLMHNFEKHTAIRKFKGRGYLLEFEHYNYKIKIYDKSKQYRIKKDNILRFEIKFLNSKEFNPLGVYNINDLKDVQVLNKLFNYLLKRYDELLIVDGFSSESISDKDVQKLGMYSSFSYWENLINNNQRQTKMNNKRKYLKMLENYKLLERKNYLREQLIAKFKQLMVN